MENNISPNELNIYLIIEEFRVWQKRWDLYGMSNSKQKYKPESVNEFIKDLASKYEVSTTK